MKRLVVFFGIALLVHGCTNIWNGADLQKWVHKQAVVSGCEPNSIVLDEWYTVENGNNIWRGICNDDKHGAQTRLQINVDKVWKPSGG